jgi:hypothetical protein
VDLKGIGCKVGLMEVSYAFCNGHPIMAGNLLTQLDNDQLLYEPMHIGVSNNKIQYPGK